MRKRTVNHVADTIFWYILYFLPVLAYFVYIFAFGQNPAVDFEVFNGWDSFESFCAVNFPVSVDNVIYNSLYNLFGDVGLIPLFDNASMCIFFAHFVSVYLLHLMVDFMLFIPRLAHKWLKMFTRGDE